MKKFTSLLMMLCMFVGAVNAEVTKYYKPDERLSTLTEGQKVMFYNTAFDGNQDRTGFLIDNAGNFALNKQKPSASPIFSEKVGVWTLENVANTDGAYTMNVKGANGYVGIGGKTNNASAQVLRFQEWTVAADGKKANVNSEDANGTKVNNEDITAEAYVWLVTNENQSNTWNGNTNSFANWSTGHPYAVYSVVEATTEEYGILDSILRTDGKGLPFLHMKAGGSVCTPSYFTVDHKMHYIYQEGRTVFKYAVSNMSDVTATIAERNGLSKDNIDWVIPHQANMRIIDAVASRLAVPMEKVMVNIQRYGNTSAGTLPLCLWDYEQRLKKGDNLIFTAFGAGFTYGAVYVKWGYDGNMK